MKKFRAWLINENKWLSSGFSISMDGLFWYDDNDEEWPVEGNIILSQFIGRLDCECKEIFEGDIVVNGLSGTWVIQPLEQGSMSLLGICKQYKDRNFDISALNQNVKVIGNIYEKPSELISNEAC